VHSVTFSAKGQQIQLIEDILLDQQQAEIAVMLEALATGLYILHGPFVARI